MMGRLVIIGLITCGTFLNVSPKPTSDIAEENPCLSYRLLPRAAYRGGHCAYNGAKPVCDSFLDKAWYRAQTQVKDLQIQTTPAAFETCGARFPYWMNGSHPKVDDGKVERRLCHYSPLGNCSDTISIEVKNCTNYFVYKLPGLPTCDNGYCFGANDSCPPYDPCDIFEYTEISHESTVKSGDNSGCKSLNDSMWVKFTGISPLDTLNQSSLTAKYNCPYTSLVPVNSTYRNQTGAKIEQLCFKYANGTCAMLMEVQSKQCDGFKVYNLQYNVDTPCSTYCVDGTSKKWSISWKNHEKDKGSHARKMESGFIFYIGLAAISNVVIKFCSTN